jgi:hypothetical protein
VVAVRALAFDSPGLSEGRVFSQSSRARLSGIEKPVT